MEYRIVSACVKVERMTHVQIRNMPEPLHRKLKARAALAGLSLSDYLLAEVERSADLPTLAEWLTRVRSGEHLEELSTRPAELIRADRDER
jgi:antitoxin FitA